MFGLPHEFVENVNQNTRCFRALFENPDTKIRFDIAVVYLSSVVRVSDLDHGV